MPVTALLPLDYSPRYVGDLGNPFTVQFVHSDLSPYSLAGVNKALMTFRMKNMTSGVARNGTGSWGTGNDATGIAVYNWGAADVAQKGTHLIQTTVPFPAGTITFRPLEIEFILTI